MKNLLKFEFRKLLHSKSFYICAIILALIGIISVASMSLLMSITEFALQNAEGVILEDMIILEELKQQLNGKFFLLNSVYSSDLVLILAIFIGIFLCGDFSEGTIKNILSRGESRTKYLTAKLIVCGIATIILTVITMLVGFVSGTIAGGVGADWSAKIIIYILLQMLIVLAFGALFALIAILIRKVAGSIALGVFMSTIVNIFLLLIDRLIEAIFKSSDFSTLTYWLDTCLVNISASGATNATLFTALGSGLGFLALGVGLAYLVLRKKDV